MNLLFGMSGLVVLGVIIYGGWHMAQKGHVMALAVVGLWIAIIYWQSEILTPVETIFDFFCIWLFIIIILITIDVFVSMADKERHKEIERLINKKTNLESKDYLSEEEQIMIYKLEKQIKRLNLDNNN